MVMLCVVNCASTCVNQTSGSTSQNEGSLRLTTATAEETEELEVDDIAKLRLLHGDAVCSELRLHLREPNLWIHQPEWREFETNNGHSWRHWGTRGGWCRHAASGSPMSLFYYQQLHVVITELDLQLTYKRLRWLACGVCRTFWILDDWHMVR